LYLNTRPQALLVILVILGMTENLDLLAHKVNKGNEENGGSVESVERLVRMAVTA